MTAIEIWWSGWKHKGNQEELRKLCANWSDKDFDKKWAKLVLSLMDGITDKAIALRDEERRQGEGLARLCKELIQTIQQLKDWDGDGDPLENVDLDRARELLKRHTAKDGVE